MSLEMKYCNFDAKAIKIQGIFAILRPIPPNFLIRDFYLSLKNFLRVSSLFGKSEAHFLLKWFLIIIN